MTTPIEEIPVGLAGSHQKLNAALAVKALERAGVQIPDAALREGLTEVTWPGRFQRLKNDRLILDGAHNESAAKRLVQTWTEVFGTEKAAIILGILKDKDMAAICHALQPIASAWILVTVHSPRTAHPEELLNILQPLQPDADFRVASDFAQALDLAESRPERTLLTGSLFLVGEALAHIAGGQHQTSAQ